MLGEQLPVDTAADQNGCTSTAATYVFAVNTPGPVEAERIYCDLFSTQYPVDVRDVIMFLLDSREVRFVCRLDGCLPLVHSSRGECNACILVDQRLDGTPPLGRKSLFILGDKLVWTHEVMTLSQMTAEAAL